MSVKTSYSLVCDYCGHQSAVYSVDQLPPGEKSVCAFMRKQGWKVTNKKDACPECKSKFGTVKR